MLHWTHEAIDLKRCIGAHQLASRHFVVLEGLEACLRGITWCKQSIGWPSGTVPSSNAVQLECRVNPGTEVVGDVDTLLALPALPHLDASAANPQSG